MRSPLLSFVIVATGLAAPLANACINDRQVIVAENEFRSSYLKKQEPPLRVTAGGWIAGGVGVALTGATIVSSRRSRSRK